jgi:IS30 family transposase
MWERWKKGDSLQQIAQLFDRNHSSIQGIFVQTGGIRPPERTRSRLALTLDEREAISRGIASGQSMRSIATELGRSPSTISREISRNGGPESYRANQSDQSAWDRAHRPQTCKLVLNKALAHLVADKLQHYWSPQQIAGWLKETYPDQEDYQVSHETIYLKDSETVVNALIKHARKLPQELYKSLTWDRGKEMSEHKRFTLATDVQVYFCDPQHPWQRGSNENTNGLLRQYFPKGMSLANYSQAKLNAVARQLNERPRKTLNYQTPAERFALTVASTG